MDRISRDCWFLTGHTAAGKSRVGVELARSIGAEIIALDSMTVYRGMDIGTAKPAPELRSSVPHHLIDIVDADTEFTLHDYLRLAAEKVRDIHGRGCRVLFVGGTPLYLKGLLRGVFEGPPADPAFRQAVHEELQQVGPEALHQRLQQVDPLSAAKLHPHNTRRIIRALEVYRATGQPISHLQLQFDNPSREPHRRIVMLDWPRQQIHSRIDVRVEEMFRRGLLAETAALLARFSRLSRTAIQAVGYREAIACLQAQLDVQQAVHQTQIRTHRLARRQETWFRSLPEIQRLPMWSEPPTTTAARVAAMVRALDPNA